MALHPRDINHGLTAMSIQVYTDFMRKMIAFRIDAALLAKVLKLVARSGKTKTALIERGLELVLKEGSGK